MQADRQVNGFAQKRIDLLTKMKLTRGSSSWMTGLLSPRRTCWPMTKASYSARRSELCGMIRCKNVASKTTISNYVFIFIDEAHSIDAFYTWVSKVFDTSAVDLPWVCSPCDSRNTLSWELQLSFKETVLDTENMLVALSSLDEAKLSIRSMTGLIWLNPTDAFMDAKL